ncbi:MAG: hypothetical protein SFX72_01825 [Isosphaeraceae bacterium]|nr:hypothetical protein [Isosphaeraceae bacterium]
MAARLGEAVRSDRGGRGPPPGVRIVGRAAGRTMPASQTPPLDLGIGREARPGRRTSGTDSARIADTGRGVV